MCSSETKPHPTRPILIFVIADASGPSRVKTPFIANRHPLVGRRATRKSPGEPHVRASVMRLRAVACVGKKGCNRVNQTKFRSRKRMEQAKTHYEVIVVGAGVAGI